VTAGLSGRKLAANTRLGNQPQRRREEEEQRIATDEDKIDGRSQKHAEANATFPSVSIGLLLWQFLLSASLRLGGSISGM
jgi:hypothetical protein